MFLKTCRTLTEVVQNSKTSWDHKKTTSLCMTVYVFESPLMPVLLVKSSHNWYYFNTQIFGRLSIYTIFLSAESSTLKTSDSKSCMLFMHFSARLELWLMVDTKKLNREDRYCSQVSKVDSPAKWNSWNSSGPPASLNSCLLYRNSFLFFFVLHNLQDFYKNKF